MKIRDEQAPVGYNKLAKVLAILLLICPIMALDDLCPSFPGVHLAHVLSCVQDTCPIRPVDGGSAVSAVGG